jgi:hypothetical protein
MAFERAPASQFAEKLEVAPRFWVTLLLILGGAAFTAAIDGLFSASA